MYFHGTFCYGCFFKYSPQCTSMENLPWNMKWIWNMDIPWNMEYLPLNIVHGLKRPRYEGAYINNDEPISMCALSGTHNSLDRLHRAYPSLHPFGVVHWVPVLSNIKTATGCESNRQLQLWTVFAGTVVNNYQFNGIQGWAEQLCQNKLPGCHLANAWRSRSKHILQWRYRNEVSVHSQQFYVAHHFLEIYQEIKKILESYIFKRLQYK